MAAAMPGSALRRFKREARVRLGLFRRPHPVGRDFGMSRGTPIDRYFIEGFISRHRADIRGRVLEAGGFVSYGRKFGDGTVEQLDIMYPKPGFADGTLVADLVSREGLAPDRYDCLILTQVFGCLFEVQAAVATCFDILRPGGVLLATMGCIGPRPLYDKQQWGAYWNFTDDSALRLIGDAFGQENTAVEAYGNAGVACAFLQGLALEDLSEKELAYRDPQFQVTICARAVKAA